MAVPGHAAPLAAVPADRLSAPPPRRIIRGVPARWPDGRRCLPLTSDVPEKFGSDGPRTAMPLPIADPGVAGALAVARW